MVKPAGKKKVASKKAPAKKTGPISAGGVAQLKKPARGGDGGFMNFKKMFSGM